MSIYKNELATKSQTTELDLTNEERTIVDNTNLNTSQKIRALDNYYGGNKSKRGRIAKILNKRYQHVRNVLITPVKKS